MVKLNRTSTPTHASVMLMACGADGLPVRSLGIAEASNMLTEEGKWYLNRLKATTPGKGDGAKLIEALQEVLAENEHFKFLVVEPGGYGSDEDRLVKFYESHGFVRDDARMCWVWRPTAPRARSESTASPDGLIPGSP